MGRKSGRPRRTPVANRRIGGQFWIVAEHGMKAEYILNIERSPRVPQQKLNLLTRCEWKCRYLRQQSHRFEKSPPSGDLEGRLYLRRKTGFVL
jgi:hypothetical protein